MEFRRFAHRKHSQSDAGMNLAFFKFDGSIGWIIFIANTIENKKRPVLRNWQKKNKKKTPSYASFRLCCKMKSGPVLQELQKNNCVHANLCFQPDCFAAQFWHGGLDRGLGIPWGTFMKRTTITKERGEELHDATCKQDVWKWSFYDNYLQTGHEKLALTRHALANWTSTLAY